MTPYQDIIAKALNDVGGNGHRAEGAARAALACIYTEAMGACEDARESGFPLTLFSTLEDFLLTAAASGLESIVAPGVTFSRRGAVVRIEARKVSAGALSGAQDVEEWMPAASVDLRADCKKYVLRSVELLVRNHALAQKR